MSSKKVRNHYGLKEMENVKNVKIVSVAWHFNVWTEMFIITEKSALLYEKKTNFWPAPTKVAIIFCC